jgi:FkbM family methyltransferase
MRLFSKRDDQHKAIIAELKHLREEIKTTKKAVANLSKAVANQPTIDYLRLALKDQTAMTAAMAAFIESDDKIFDIFFDGVKTKFYLPQGASDRTQSDILRTSGFYQSRPLRHLYRSGLLKPGASVIDVGANIGNHTLFFANILAASTIHAFEPNPMVLPILKRNIELNMLQDVVVLREIGLGEAAKRGRNQLPIASHIGRNEVIDDENGDVEIRRLDDLGIDAADLIKIDVEGHAAGVILGGWETIGRHKPLILIEATSEPELRVVEKLKNSYGYNEKAAFGHDLLLAVN